MAHWTKEQRREALSKLLAEYAAQDIDEPKPPIEHTHSWYRAGTLRHPRMGWYVGFYLCTEIHWSNDIKCYSVCLGRRTGPEEDFEPDEHLIFKDFNEAYYWLGAP